MATSYSLGVEVTERETRRLLVNIRTGEALVDFDERQFNIVARMTVSDERSRAIASLPGAGVASPSTMVIRVSDRIDLVMNSRVEGSVPNLVSAERDAILPGFFGYVITLDAINDPEHMGFRIRDLCDRMRDAGIPVRRFVLISRRALEIAQTLANVLGEKIRVVLDEFVVVARGAAILAAIRSDQTEHAHQSQLIHAMAPAQPGERTFRPVLAERRRFDALYRELDRSRFGPGAV